jgi:hypothetical protein
VESVTVPINLPLKDCPQQTASAATATINPREKYETRARTAACKDIAISPMDFAGTLAAAKSESDCNSPSLIACEIPWRS